MWRPLVKQLHDPDANMCLIHITGADIEWKKENADAVIPAIYTSLNRIIYRYLINARTMQFKTIINAA